MLIWFPIWMFVMSLMIRELRHFRRQIDGLFELTDTWRTPD
jgi:hypothetical protein